MKPKKAEKIKSVSVYDTSIPLGVRKQSFVKWLMKRGVGREKAKLICSRKFFYGEPRR
jgi:hypothetical protein